MTDLNRLAILGLEALVAKLEERIERLENVAPIPPPPPQPPFVETDEAKLLEKLRHAEESHGPNRWSPWDKPLPFTPSYPYPNQPYQPPYQPSISPWIYCTNMDSPENPTVSDSEYVRHHSLGRKEYKRD